MIPVLYDTAYTATILLHFVTKCNRTVAVYVFDLHKLVGGINKCHVLL